MNFNPYIYILYYQSNLLNYLPPNPVSCPYKITCEHNIVAIRECCYANVDKQRMLLADVGVTPPRGVV